MKRPNEETKNNTGRAMPEAASGIPAKIIRYLMLFMLLVLVFIVSAYAGNMRRAEKSGRDQSSPESPGGGMEEAEKGGQENSGQEKAEQEGSAQEMTGQEGNVPDEAGQGTKGTIVLDAGHGGFDPGVSGADGIAERELNLVFAQKLEKLLTEEGYRVVLTRTTEAGLYDEGQTHKKAQDMQRRCAIIEEARPLVSVSIHQNSYPDSSVSGPQVFYYATSKEGERLAACIQNCMNEELEVKAPKKQKGNESYYILKRSAGTTVIVECGFLTNPEEEKMLQNEAYQDRLVSAIRDGILRYLQDGTDS